MMPDMLMNMFPTTPHLFLISAAIVMKASSTFVAFFALVSRKGIPISSAKAYNQIEGKRRIPKHKIMTHKRETHEEKSKFYLCSLSIYNFFGS